MARIHFSTPLRRFTGGVAEVEIDAPTVKALIAELDRRFPGIAEPLDKGTAVAIDGEIIAHATYEPIPDGAEVHFVSAPSGGGLEFHLAQFNLARLRQPLDHEATAEFVSVLDPVNAIAEASPGFIWRLQDDEGNSSTYISVPGLDDPMVIVNYTIWRDVESLRHYVYKSGHGNYFRRRREWFEPSDEATMVCWWTPADAVADVGDAYKRLVRLREHGPSDDGWHFNHPYPSPDEI